MIFWKSIKLLEMTGLNHVFYVEVQDLMNAPRKWACSILANQTRQIKGKNTTCGNSKE